jgi:hypothetical protein
MTLPFAAHMASLGVALFVACSFLVRLSMFLASQTNWSLYYSFCFTLRASGITLSEFPCRDPHSTTYCLVFPAPL